ncbi:uncharacterized protein LOC117581011 [Drosophila guanche]|uniref:Right handed beta helix domain-containing protein n=1 Tax=Drosophila guanche TaxID=7266 RepID=A0A3B0JVI3_DROGU|nr:uncharacterized protein LOC117581011 [Drosophila guanche]SPP77729.1 Hypothetical predicted protein [Drosophila guanche]
MSGKLTMLLLILGTLLLVVCDVEARGRPLYGRLPIAAYSGSWPAWNSAAAGAPASLITETSGENICNHCHCLGKMVTCDFKQNRTLSPKWDSKYFVPVAITAMRISLAGRTQFELHNEFFRGNRVNFFDIVGQGSTDSDQVELTKNAFQNNLGGYPDIQVRNVQRVFIREGAFSGGEFKLLVENSHDVVLFPRAFQNMNISCSFRHVENLEMKEETFYPNSDSSAKSLVNLRIEDTKIEKIGSFDVSMLKVSFVKATIDRIQTNAFDVTEIKELSFEDCHIGTIEARALTSKLRSDHVSFKGTTIGMIDSEAIIDCGISRLTLKNNTIMKIKSNAMQIFSVFVFIQDNTVKHTEHNWLRVKDGEHIVIENNSFGQFNQFGLELAKLSKPFNCTFANNRLEDPEQNSLNFSNCEVHRITVGHDCSCDNEWMHRLTDHDLDSEIICPLVATDRGCFNASSVNRRRFVHEACGGGHHNVSRHCTNGQWSTRTASDLLGSGGSLTIGQIGMYIVGFIVAVGLASLIVLGLTAVCKRGRSGNSSAAGSGDSDLCSFTDDARRTMLKQTESLRDGDSTRKSIRKLMSGKLSRIECKNQVIDTIKEMPNGSSIIKDLLTQHLLDCHDPSGSGSSNSHSHSHSHSNSNGPASQGGGDYYATSTMPHDSPSASAAPSAPNYEEPIYEEPQQPLLTSEYSSPSDPMTETPVYSEPINSTAPPSSNAINDIPPAYQYALPMRHLGPPQLPSTRGQQQPQLPPAPPSQQHVSYATPVWRATASATPNSRPPTGGAAGGSGRADIIPQRHVRDLRQDLEAMPQFHPNQLTSARHQRQFHHPQTQPQPQSQSQPQVQPPPYSQRMGAVAAGTGTRGRVRSFECLDGAASLAAMEHMDSGSDHSGGSDETVQIGDVIDYADA